MKRINGKLSNQLDAADRGLLYGDGVFETMRCVDGSIPLLDRHMARLAASLERLGIPEIPLDLLKIEIAACATARGNGIVKLIVTRGPGYPGARGYRPPASPSPTLIVEDFPLPEWPARWLTDGVVVRTCATRLPTDDPLAGMKTLNRLPQVLARQEWSDPAISADVAEGIMLDGSGFVIEGTMSNVLYRRRGQWHTPPITSGVSGVMRKLLIEECDVTEQALHLDAREEVESLQLCNSVLGVWNVLQWDDMRFSSGTIPEPFQDIVKRYFME